jgi:hypothetical protein
LAHADGIAIGADGTLKPPDRTSAGGSKSAAE